MAGLEVDLACIDFSFGRVSAMRSITVPMRDLMARV